MSCLGFAEREIPSRAENFLSSPVQLGPETYAVNGQPLGHTETANALLTGNVLFDPGSEKSLPQLLRNLSLLQKSPAEHYLVFLTHPHADHIGGVAGFIDTVTSCGGDVTVYAPRNAREVIYQADRFKTAAFLYPDTSLMPFRVDREVVDGDEIIFGEIAITAVSAPGHSEYDMAYLVDDHGKRILVSGDAVAGSGMHEKQLGSNFDAYKESQYKLLSYDYDAIYEGHGNPAKPLTKAAYTDIVSSRLVQTRGELFPGFRGLMSTLHGETT